MSTQKITTEKGAVKIKLEATKTNEESIESRKQLIRSYF